MALRDRRVGRCGGLPGENGGLSSTEQPPILEMSISFGQ